MKIKALLLLSFLISCQSIKQEISLEVKRDTANKEDLYWGPMDSIVRKADATIIYNSRMDTTITEVGIFAYLRHDYRVNAGIPDSVYYPVKKAIYYAELGKHRRARKYHQLVRDYYQKHWPTSTHGYMWSCGNAVYSHKVNTSILLSYSLEELGSLDESIDVLKPYLANSETSYTKIHRRYIEQCVKKYGLEQVKEEVSTCGNTIKLKNINASALDQWVVTVYGADIRVVKTWLGDITPHQADSVVKLMGFYELLE